MPITIRYPFRPVRRSLASGRVADLFGLADAEPPHTVAENVELGIRPGDLVLFTGPSGSGKSSLLRAAGNEWNAVDMQALPLPDAPLIDALPGTVEERLSLLAACGLSEARQLLRTPAELSEGQRYRFRIAYGLSESGGTASPCDGSTEGHRPSAFGSPLLCDEFAALLDRPLARVLAFNLRKLVSATGRTVLCATTHDDIACDLNPDVHVRCLGDGRVEVERRAVKKKRHSVHDDLWLSDDTRGDWPHFARWHYRSHTLAFVRRVILLWHGAEPIGVCVFGSPAASLTLRTRYFGLANPRSSAALQALNAQLWLLQRVVLHPTYRGAGIAAAFVRRACELCPVPWIETLSAMGHANPFFERAGFVRVGVVTRTGSANGAYGTKAKASAESARKSAFGEPVYYVRDNRSHVQPRASGDGQAGNIRS